MTPSLTAVQPGSAAEPEKSKRVVDFAGVGGVLGGLLVVAAAARTGSAAVRTRSGMRERKGCMGDGRSTARRVKWPHARAGPRARPEG
jgi:hypothetical protein